MYEHMDGLLSRSTQSLGFVVIFPCWEGEECWKLFRDCRFTRSVVLRARVELSLALTQVCDRDAMQ